MFDFLAPYFSWINTTRLNYAILGIFIILFLEALFSKKFKKTAKKIESKNIDLFFFMFAALGIQGNLRRFGSFGLGYYLSYHLNTIGWYGFRHYLGEEHQIALAFISLFVYDTAFYFYHRTVHSIPFLFRWHRLHHCAQPVTVWITNRNHPIDTIVKGLFMSVAWAIIGPNIETLFLLTLFQFIQSHYTHSKLLHEPGWLGRWIFTTSRLHHSHHSSQAKYQMANYGGIFIIWDRLLGTYRSPLKPGDEGYLTWGMDDLDGDLSFYELLVMPYKSLTKD